MKLFRLNMQKALAYLFAYSSKLIIRILLWTCHLEVEGLSKFIDTASKNPSILVLWHNRLALMAEFLHRYAPLFVYTAFISKSKDGEALAILAESYKIGKVIRVAHNLRHQALKNAISLLKKNGEVLIITPDGPRGPRYQMKPGISVAAREASAFIIPFTWTSDRYWELKTWDKMRIPKPFSRILVSIGDPLAVSETLTIEEETLTLQSHLRRFSNRNEITR